MDGATSEHHGTDRSKESKAVGTCNPERKIKKQKERKEGKQKKIASHRLAW